jgi:hypothetical protein
MPKEKYDPPDPRRIYTIMSAEEVANGKKSHWAELEISGEWNLKHFIWNIIATIVKSIAVLIGSLLCFNWKN